MTRSARPRRRLDHVVDQDALQVTFVCTGNICRSPMAEKVFVHELERAGLADRVRVTSAGTGDWHVGSAPDERSTAAAAARGIRLEGAARQVTAGDFGDWDLLIAMDRANQRELERLAPDDEARAKVSLLREYDPLSVAEGDLEVPDPYYGGEDGFEHVLEVVERACRALLDEIS